VPILLQKSFWGNERKFLEPLTRGDVRDHIRGEYGDDADILYRQLVLAYVMGRVFGSTSD
jgi:hypothetical protein